MSVESALVAIAIPLWFITVAVCLIAAKSFIDPFARLVEKRQAGYGRVPVETDIH